LNKENISFYNQTTIYFQNNSWIPLLILLIIAVSLRLPNLNESLWLDELWSTHVKLGNIILLGRQVLYDSHPPFYYLFMFSWIRLFGDSELSIRIPPLIFGVLSIFLTYKLALRFVGKKGAFLTAFLMSLTPVHIWYSQEARHYSAILFFLLLSIFSYYKLRESRSNSTWYFVYFGSLFSAAFSHFYVSVYLGIISIMCLSKINKTKRNVLMLNILIIVCLVAYLEMKSILGGSTTGLGHLRPFTPIELWMLFFNWFLLGNSLWNINPYGSNPSVIVHKPLMFFIQVVFFAFFINGVIQILKESKERKDLEPLALILYVFSLPLFLLCLNFIGFKNTYIERSVFVVLPFFYILIAKGITCFKYKPISIASTIFTITLSIVTLTSYFKKIDEWTVYKPNPNWRAAAHYFNNELKNTTNPLIVFTTTPATELTYYDSRFEEFEVRGLDESDKILYKAKLLAGEDNYFVKKLSFDLYDYLQALRNKIANAKLLIFYRNENNKENIYETLFANNEKTFYLIHNRYWSGNFKALSESVMKDSRFQLVGVKSFKGLEIFKFRVVS